MRPPIEPKHSPSSFGIELREKRRNPKTVDLSSRPLLLISLIRPEQIGPWRSIPSEINLKRQKVICLTSEKRFPFPSILRLRGSVGNAVLSIFHSVALRRKIVKKRAEWFQQDLWITRFAHFRFPPQHRVPLKDSSKLFLRINQLASERRKAAKTTTLAGCSANEADLIKRSKLKRLC